MGDRPKRREPAAPQRHRQSELELPGLVTPGRYRQGVASGSGLSFFDDIFSSALAGTPGNQVADICLRRAAGGLVADDDPLRRSLGAALDGATIKTGPSGEKSVIVSIAVQGSKLNLVRENLALIRAELSGQFTHDGWKLTGLNVVAAEVQAAAPTAPPKKHQLVNGLAEAIAAAIKAYDVAAVCDDLGMPAHPNPLADPFSSKRIYVTSRIQIVEIERVVGMARRFLEDYDDASLEALLSRYRPAGHGGTVKNVVFGSTRKPDLVLLDALSNDLGLINKDEALLFDGGIPEDGLSWRQLVTALLPAKAAVDLRKAGLDLYRRLVECLASAAERNLFRVYAERYARLGFDQPALMPQVWLHYDPKAAWRSDGASPLNRQRMDFLLLVEGRRRVVIEVDGIHHYSDDAGRTSPGKYAEMVRADRDLRLAGYEVYRFGGVELVNIEDTRALLEPFLDSLLKIG
jgi:hypothetical protein